MEDIKTQVVTGTDIDTRKKHSEIEDSHGSRGGKGTIEE